MMTYISFVRLAVALVMERMTSVKRKCGVKILIQTHLPLLVVYSIECSVFRVGSSY